jgi:hypothetical protein
MKNFFSNGLDHELKGFNSIVRPKQKFWKKNTEILSNDFFLIQERIFNDKVRVIDNFFINYPNFSENIMVYTGVNYHIKNTFFFFDEIFSLKNKLLKKDYFDLSEISDKTFKSFKYVNALDKNDRIAVQDFPKINFYFLMTDEAQMAAPFVGYLD